MSCEIVFGGIEEFSWERAGGWSHWGGCDGMTVVNFYSAFRQAFNEQTAVGLGQKSRVQNDDTPCVVAVTNQTPEALLEFDDCFGGVW